MGAPNHDAGIAYILFGKNISDPDAINGDIDLSSAVTNTTMGFRVLGAAVGDQCGVSVSGAGDINGDGVDDIIIGANRADPPGIIGDSNAGITYILYGRKMNLVAEEMFGDIRLSTTAMAINKGFRILGAAAEDKSGYSVSAAGDVNGDGMDDIILGAYTASVSAGIVYVIFGRNVPGGATPFSDILLSSIVSGSAVGFRILGAAAGDDLGYAVAASASGDINDDGVDDILIGARNADPTAAEPNAGISYVLFGPKSVAGSVVFGDVNAASIASNSQIGFMILGATSGVTSGRAVSGAGDLNGDTVNDIIVGTTTGSCYVIYGTPASPTSQPSSQPSRQPSMQPSVQPSRQPTQQPSSQSSRQPSGQPSVQPTRQPSSQPSRQPTQQPSTQPSSQPSSQPLRQPSGQPSSQPTRRPSGQPTSQPSRQPSSQPSSHPSGQPSAQPSKQPSAQPNSRPSSQPSRQPIAYPSGQPSQQPSLQPSGQPSSQPSLQPTNQPSLRPSKQPSVQPTSQPSNQPSMQPTVAPTEQPAMQPTCQPTSLPSKVPTGQPSKQPSVQPTTVPSGQPSAQPSIAPKSQPTVQPSSQPSAKPSRKPSCLPTARPSVQPTMAPSAQPSSQPSFTPSVQPSGQPTALPTVQPSTQPSISHSKQPSSQPTQDPTFQLTLHPSTQPSMHPQVQPTSWPSSQPSLQPIGQLGAAPTLQPSLQPSERPSSLPSALPRAQPTSSPSSLPSSQSSAKPSVQPTSQPSGVPSVQPSQSPTAQPSMQPSQLPRAAPTTQPSAAPSLAPTTDPHAGAWVTNISRMDGVNKAVLVNNELWACGRKNVSSVCVVLNARKGFVVNDFDFVWSEIVSVIQTDDLNRVILGGRTVSSLGSVSSDLANCRMEETKLTCVVKSFYGTFVTAVTYVPYSKKILLAGLSNVFASLSIVDEVIGSFQSYLYASKQVNALSFTHIKSPPNFVGAFVAGTAVSTSGALNYIISGMVRTDTGIMTAMYLTPVGGTILNSVDLVNAMAQEYVHPDSFLTGGLELSDGVGMHAYLLRVNALIGVVKYGVRYRAFAATTTRRSLSEVAEMRSVARGLALQDNVVYMIVDLIRHTGTSLTVLKLDAQTGLILQQVHVFSPNASLSCTDITTSENGLFLYITCQVRHTGAATESVISVDSQFSFARLPAEFIRSASNIFAAENVPFKKTALPVSVQSAQSFVVDFEFSTTDRTPTLSPSVIPTTWPSMQPSSAPSGQPSSSPTSAPSVSPQPTSHPSSSGPTNTYKPTVKPTVKPTQRPSVSPSRVSTTSPSKPPSITPTVQPPVQPSLIPSMQPSSTRPPAPTRAPSRRPSPFLSLIPTISPTSDGTTEDEGGRKKSDNVLVIGGSIIGGLIALWGGNWLLKCVVYLLHAQKKRKARREIMLAERNALDEAQVHLVRETVRQRTAAVTRGAKERAHQVSQSHSLPRETSAVHAIVESTRFSTGAYATGLAVTDASRSRTHSPVLEGIERQDGGQGSNSASSLLASSASNSSSCSSSFVLSSLRSSEMSDVQYSVHSDDLSSEEPYSQLPHSKSEENIL